MPVREESVRIGSTEFKVFVVEGSGTSGNDLALLGEDGCVIDTALFSSFVTTFVATGAGVDVVFCYSNLEDFSDEYEDIDGLTPIEVGTPYGLPWTYYANRYLRIKFKSSVADTPGILQFSAVCRP